MPASGSWSRSKKLKRLDLRTLRAGPEHQRGKNQFEPGMRQVSFSNHVRRCSMAEALKMTIHGIKNGICSLSGKEAECIQVTLEDGTVQNSPLSFKSLGQLLRMKFAQNGPKPVPPTPASVPIAAICASEVGRWSRMTGADGRRFRGGCVARSCRQKGRSRHWSFGIESDQHQADQPRSERWASWIHSRSFWNGWKQCRKP